MDVQNENGTSRNEKWDSLLNFFMLLEFIIRFYNAICIRGPIVWISVNWAFSLLGLGIVGLAIHGYANKKRMYLIPLLALKVLTIICCMYMVSSFGTASTIDLVRIGIGIIEFMKEIIYFSLLIKVWFEED